MNKIVYVITFLAVNFIFMKNALHMFQQNRYEFKRYTKWLFTLTPFFVKLVLLYVVLMIVCLFIPKYYAHIICIVVSLIFACLFICQEAKKEYIKPLVYTARVKRTLVVYYVLMILSLLGLITALNNHVSLVGIISIPLAYILIYPVALILKPFEYAIKKKYENEARKILAKQDDLIKIGITGSYGKTTTKNIVGQILDSKYYTLITPASYNTPMGITRTIREYLKRVHEVFVCEMGADHVGDITYLMKMVKPKYGIVSSIGPQHLNTFRTLDNIIHEKMQEIELLPEDGVGIINIDNKYIANYQIRNICKILTVGINNETADYVASNIKYSKDGSSFDVNIKNKKYHFVTKLIGEHNISNILLGIALADELGIEPQDIVKAVESLSQVEHRLEMKNINGYNFIDDAFNSNPVGSLYALKALSMMPGKRVVVTPGLIDLGEMENRANYNFGRNMWGAADFVILVGKNQTKYILKGLKDAGFNMDNVITVDRIYDAFNYVYSNFKTTDTILLENDLPDAFNK